jgi:hypothetical protein
MDGGAEERSLKNDEAMLDSVGWRVLVVCSMLGSVWVGRVRYLFEA